MAEYYPRAADPVLGVWAHRQALAARDAGAELRVLVLHRPVPPLAALRARDAAALTAPLRQRLRDRLDGLEVTYVPFLAPPRPSSYGSWGAWAAPPLALALRALRRRFAFDLIHAHYAAPAGDAVVRARTGSPLVVSAHGGDVLSVTDLGRAGREAVTGALRAAQLVLANSAATELRCLELGARATRVVHLGTDLAPPGPPPRQPTLVSVGNLIARKRHADVLRALWLLRESHPQVRYEIVGDGPERAALGRLAHELGLASRVAFRGALPHAEAVRAARRATLFVLPSVQEAFGVAYLEAMGGGVPAVGCRGEGGPQDIAAAGGGLRLVAPGDPESLAAELAALLGDPAWCRELGRRAHATVERCFTWERCGRATVQAYEAALR